MTNESVGGDVRTKAQVDIEYTQCAIDLGDHVFKVKLMVKNIGELDKNIGDLENRMFILNEEGRKLAQAEASVIVEPQAALAPNIPNDIL